MKCGFAVDAAGELGCHRSDGDNVIFNHRNKPVRIDLGGALVFRAQGEHKGNQFGTTPMELVTMLSREDNSSSRAFRKIERNDIREGIAAIEKYRMRVLPHFAQNTALAITANALSSARD